MKAFASLYAALDASTRTSVKVAAMADYFRTAPDADKLWTVALFSGRRPKRTITASRLRIWAAEAAGLPLWLLEESYAVAGDLAETITLILPPPAPRPAPGSGTDDLGLSQWMDRLKQLSAGDDEARKAGILAAWSGLQPAERFVFTKLLTGGFRVGISQKLMTRALAQATGQDETSLAHRLMGNWTPATTSWQALIMEQDPAADLSRPYPFYLAHPLDDPAGLGDPADWSAERKWDGIRGQFILRGGTHHLWSRGEDLITDRFPELAQLCDFLPDGTAIDGEILAFRDERPLSFNALQSRIGRKTVPKKLLAEAPVVLMAYDLLEAGGKDIRQTAFADRRQRLEELVARLPASVPLRLSPAVAFSSWDMLAAERARAREHQTEGLMIKRRDSPYLAGRKKGDWWKWKIDPLTIDAVLIYAQSGAGRRANLFTDYTFAVWNGTELTPFAKAYSGLTDAEFRDITAWVRRNTLQKFGPVRQVKPTHVFEIAFEGIQASPRHKSGVALRFPRMLRWRRDKPPSEANTLDDLRQILHRYG